MTKFHCLIAFTSEILDSMCILISLIIIIVISFPVDDVINFEINLNFFIKQFSYVAKKKSGQKFCLKKVKGFEGEMKSIFYLFKGFSVSRN